MLVGRLQLICAGHLASQDWITDERASKANLGFARSGKLAQQADGLRHLIPALCVTNRTHTTSLHFILSY